MRTKQNYGKQTKLIKKNQWNDNMKENFDIFDITNAWLMCNQNLEIRKEGKSGGGGGNQNEKRLGGDKSGKDEG